MFLNGGNSFFLPVSLCPLPSTTLHLLPTPHRTNRVCSGMMEERRQSWALSTRPAVLGEGPGWEQQPAVLSSSPSHEMSSGGRLSNRQTETANPGVTGLRARSMNHPEQSLCAPGGPLTHSQGSQCLGDVTSLSLGEEFHPRVASEEFVPMGNTQASQGEKSQPQETGSGPV